jgi:hypothetical protein
MLAGRHAVPGRNGLLFFTPPLGMMVGATISARSGPMKDVGIDDSFIKHADIREVGVVKVETGLTQRNLYFYHPNADLFLEEDLGKRGDGADTVTAWHCRSYKRPEDGTAGLQRIVIIR